VTFVGQSGTTGNYSVNAPHTYRDEFNCGSGPISTCGYPVLVQVTNGSKFGAGGCPTCSSVAIKDQQLEASSTTFEFAVAVGVTYSGALGVFHDDNNQALAADGKGAEYAVAISWGDGAVSQGSFKIPTPCNPNPGPGAGEGCDVAVSAAPTGHAYATTGTYPVTITVTDGKNPTPVILHDMAFVKGSRQPVSQSAAAVPGPRGTAPSGAPTVGPRLAWGRGWWLAFWS
jgi:hypothetical protein